MREETRPHFFTRRVFASVPENAEPIPLKNRARYRQRLLLAPLHSVTFHKAPSKVTVPARGHVAVTFQCIWQIAVRAFLNLTMVIIAIVFYFVKHLFYNLYFLFVLLFIICIFLFCFHLNYINTLFVKPQVAASRLLHLPVIITGLRPLFPVPRCVCMHPEAFPVSLCWGRRSSCRTHW